jgi:DNA-binding winged helix-turn-helix (wHTH) protein
MENNRGRVQFQPEEYKITHAADSIHLLPKEYALFAFLYEHKNQAFSRDELLDRVWGLEDPSDRTVDDHIYRLRKKLKGWKELLTIDTVRGYGYKMTVKEPVKADNPLLASDEFREHVHKLIEKYHGLGMGDALQLLAVYRDTFGIELDSFYSVYIRLFVGGDFHWIVDTDTLTFWEKAFYLLHIYSHIQFDAEKSIFYFERMAKNEHLLPEKWRKEIHFILIGVYLEAGRYSEAKELVKKAEPVIAEMNSHSFTLLFYMEQLLLSLFTEVEYEAESLIRKADSLLHSYPIQRELGIFTIAKGLYHYHQGDRNEARSLVDEGINILKQTRFVPHLITGVRMILIYFRHSDVDPEWKRKCEKLWQELAEQYRFAELERKIVPLLRAHL